MKLVLVSAAWRRYAVTRLALAQRAHLCRELAERGLEATSVIVANDENLDIAREFGFETFEQTNAELGRKFNDGLEYACRELEADYVVLIGSDDWVHVDLFDRLPLEVADPPALSEERPVVFWSENVPEVITGQEIAIVDLLEGRLRRLRGRGAYGVIPWLVPRKALEPSGFRPIRDNLQKGIDGSFIAGLNVAPEWRFVDPHDLCRIDFKSDVNLNGYENLSKRIGYGDEELEPWSVLGTRYPAELVELAHRTHLEVSGAIA